MGGLHFLDWHKFLFFNAIKYFREKSFPLRRSLCHIKIQFAGNTAHILINAIFSIGLDIIKKV
jgi:hypothetical protein